MHIFAYTDHRSLVVRTVDMSRGIDGIFRGQKPQWYYNTDNWWVCHILPHWLHIFCKCWMYSIWTPVGILNDNRCTWQREMNLDIPWKWKFLKWWPRKRCFEIKGFTLHNCCPCDNSSKGCRLKHLLHANNAEEEAAVAIFIVSNSCHEKIQSLRFSRFSNCFVNLPIRDRS